MKHIFIINPTAGKYDSRQRIYEMADHLRSAHGLDVQCILTKKQGHATEIAQKLCQTGEPLRFLRLRRRRHRQRGGKRHHRL